MGGEYPVYPVREERGAQFVRFHAGIDEEDLCLGIPGEEIMLEGRAIDEEHVRGEPVARGPSAHEDVIIPIRNEELINALRQKLVTEVDRYIHVLLPF
jgi:hypothetical protein